MNGKLVAGGMVGIGLIAGVAAYYLQVYAYYRPVEALTPAAEVRLTAIGGGEETIPAAAFQGIDADSSPLRFRGCFTLPVSLATLTETYVVYQKPTPLIAPSWFSCFDAGALTEDLATGAAVAFLGQKEIRPGVDRVVAVYPDGRAFAWQQLNGSLGSGTGAP
ncbi:MAG: DUF6446 family protein [Paracoccaceae bacterium]